MATEIIIITFCALVLLAYLFDITSSKTKIPSVILLLILGWGVRQIANISGINLPELEKLLPVLGTIGLILIVLEGALSLDFNRSKVMMINKSLLGSLLSLIISAILIALAFKFIGGFPLKESLVNAIPFCIISSAIAIPSVGNLTPWKKEFVIYESSFSDIFGVLLFTFISINEVFNLRTFGTFGLHIIIMIVISFISIFTLSYFLSKIKHHIKYIPVILLIISIYSVSKIFHLPALIFILLLGLFLGNLNKFEHFKQSKRFHLNILAHEVGKFEELAVEATFLIRTIFFLVFGYLMETKEILNPTTILWAIGIVIIIYGLRVLQLKIFKLSLKPFVFVAPRGLITILLFLSITPAQQIPLVNKSLIIQVIIITAIIMMIGIMSAPKDITSEEVSSPDLEKPGEVDADS